MPLETFLNEQDAKNFAIYKINSDFSYVRFEKRNGKWEVEFKNLEVNEKKMAETGHAHQLEEKLQREVAIDLLKDNVQLVIFSYNADGVPSFWTVESKKG